MPVSVTVQNVQARKPAAVRREVAYVTFASRSHAGLKITSPSIEVVIPWALIGARGER